MNLRSMVDPAPPRRSALAQWILSVPHPQKPLPHGGAGPVHGSYGAGQRARLTGSLVGFRLVAVLALSPLGCMRDPWPAEGENAVGRGGQSPRMEHSPLPRTLFFPPAGASGGPTVNRRR